jgi:hypothetical protein
VAWSLDDPGGTRRGAVGGSAQRINRNGARWRVEVTLPPMRPAQAREWAAALIRGLRTGVSWNIRQVTTPTGSPGAVLVNGADQAGNSLIVDGGTPGFVLRQGQWFNITTGARKYLYQAASTLRLDASGAGTIELEPTLRAIPADNDPLTIAAPVIEGLLVDVPEWAIDAGRLVRGLTFAIEEVR